MLVLGDWLSRAIGGIIHFMNRHLHAVLAGHLIGLACIGASLPMLVELIGKIASFAVSSLRLPSNPGEAGYLPLILNGIIDLVAESLGWIFGYSWFVPNGATMLMLVFGVLLMCARPRWFIRLIERNIT